jgi:hypothetical protein
MFSIQVVWDNPEKTVVRYEVQGIWQWRIFEAAFRTSVLMTQSVDYRVDVILDLTETEVFPKNPVDYFVNLLPFIPDNRGAIVIAGGSIEVCDTFVALQCLYKEAGKPLFLTESVEQARAILPFAHRTMLDALAQKVAV